MAGVGREFHGFVVEVEVAGDAVVELLAAGGVPADVVGGPERGELRAAGAQLTDQRVELDMQFLHPAPPQLAALHHVGIVDRTHLAAPVCPNRSFRQRR